MPKRKPNSDLTLETPVHAEIKRKSESLVPMKLYGQGGGSDEHTKSPNQ